MTKENATRRLTWLTTWFCLNVGLTLLNKACFSKFKFPYPMTLSCVHYLCSAIGARICLSKSKIEQVQLDFGGYKKLFLFSAIFNTNILLGNASIQVVSVALSQTVRAVIPATTMLVTFLILGTTYSKRTWCAVLPVILGMMLACYGDVGNFTSYGLLILMMGCFCSGMKVVMTKVLLSGKDSFHPFDLLAKVTPLCLIQLLPFVFFLEYPRMTEVGNEVPFISWAAVFLTGFMAFSLNVSNFFTNQLVTPLTITIAGNMKQVSTIMLSIIIFNTQVSTLNGFGIIVTILGGALYSYVTYKERLAKPTPLSTSRQNSYDLKKEKLDPEYLAKETLLPGGGEA